MTTLPETQIDIPPRAPTRQCGDCRCTESRGCPGGCWWVTPNLCSRCARLRLLAAGMEAHAGVCVPIQWLSKALLHLALSQQSVDLILNRQPISPDVLAQIGEASLDLLDEYQRLAAAAGVPAIGDVCPMLRQIDPATENAVDNVDLDDVPELVTPSQRIWTPGDSER